MKTLEEQFQALLPEHLKNQWCFPTAQWPSDYRDIFNAAWKLCTALDSSLAQACAKIEEMRTAQLGEAMLFQPPSTDTPQEKPPQRPDWVIEIETVGSPSYVNESMGGDPGRTHEISHAERYATENEARENMNAVRHKYPNRKYRIKPTEALPIEEKP